VGSILGGLNSEDSSPRSSSLASSYQNLSILPPPFSILNPTISAQEAFKPIQPSHLLHESHFLVSTWSSSQTSKAGSTTKTKRQNRSNPDLPKFLNLKLFSSDNNMQYAESSFRTPCLHVQLSSMPAFNQNKQLLVPYAKGKKV
jgi:hypothetical protein